MSQGNQIEPKKEKRKRNVSQNFIKIKKFDLLKSRVPRKFERT